MPKDKKKTFKRPKAGEKGTPPRKIHGPKAKSKKKKVAKKKKQVPSVFTAVDAIRKEKARKKKRLENIGK